MNSDGTFTPNTEGRVESLEKKTKELFEEVMRMSIRVEKLEEEVGKNHFTDMEHIEFGEAEEHEESFQSEFSGGVLGSPISKTFNAT